MMEFNLHIEYVYRVSVECGGSLEKAAAVLIDDLIEGRLDLGEPNMIRAEVWDDDGDEVGEIDGWGNLWIKEE